jgi:D-3-phosphoglycerate dehydrogenase
MPRILVTDELHPEGLVLLKNESSLKIELKYGLEEEELARAISGCEGLLVRSGTQVTAAALEGADRLKVIGRAGIGVDNIDLEAATRKGILVANSPQGNVISTAEHTMGLVSALARNLVRADRSMRQGKWERKTLQGIQLRGRTLGMIGMGHVGTEVASLAKGRGMKVIAHDPYLLKDKAEKLGIPLVSMNEVLEASDFVSLHVPLNEATRNLVGSQELKRMKPTAYLVNCARGGIVDETALHEAIQQHRIAGAALDVFAEEPPTGSPLPTLEEVILTPHLGGSTEEAQRQVSIDIVRQIIAYFTEGKMPNAVNATAVLEPELVPFCRLADTLGRISAQLSEGEIRRIGITAYGTLSERDLRPITVAAVRGILFHICDGPAHINEVNALLFARERQIEISETRSEERYGYRSRLTVAVEGGARRAKVSGTLIEGGNPRIVHIDGFDVDVAPSPHMLLMRYPDRPGMVGRFGTILGNHRINIAKMEVGRRGRGQEALVILELDDPVPDEVSAELQRALPTDTLRRINL